MAINSILKCMIAFLQESFAEVASLLEHSAEPGFSQSAVESYERLAEGCEKAWAEYIDSTAREFSPPIPASRADTYRNLCAAIRASLLDFMAEAADDIECAAGLKRIIGAYKRALIVIENMERTVPSLNENAIRQTEGQYERNELMNLDEFVNGLRGV